jgi:hypothetical protein
MTFEAFEARAREIFESIPPRYREGVDGLLVEREPRPHPELEDIYTLGECRTEQYPSEYGGPGSVRSFVVVYYGSFQKLAQQSEDWDWEGELWETITHEVRHHLESLAAEDALEVEDYVLDQNFARREGKSFDPFFYRGGLLVEEGVYDVDGDLFIEAELGRDELATGAVALEWEGREVRVPLPESVADVHYLLVEGVEEENGDLVLVLLRPRGLWESLRAALAGGTPRVEQSRAVGEVIG